MASPSFKSYTFNKDYISVRTLNNKIQTGIAYVENERDIRFWDRVQNGDHPLRCMAIHGLRIHQRRFMGFLAVKRCGSVAWPPKTR